jgi:cell division protein FtsQ
MDGRGRLAQPLKWIAALRLRLPAGAAARGVADTKTARPKSRVARIMDRWSSLLESKWPRGAGVAASVLVVLASAGYGAVKGDHIPGIMAGLKDARDAVANAAGLRVTSVALAGNHHVSREEVLAAADITGATALVFLDVDEVRQRLKGHPWIADATVLKLYPGELQIGIKEREPFALWQKDGRVSVIAEDGTVLEPYVEPRLVRLPLVVGRGAQTKAKEFLALLDRYPAMRRQ